MAGTSSASLETRWFAERFEAHCITRRLGTEVRGVDLRDDLDDQTVDDLHQLLAERGVVIFTGQQIGPDRHRALAEQMGDIRMPPPYLPNLLETGFPEIGVLSTENGIGKAADTWHSDVTWSPTPPRYSILHMQVVPEAAGDTMWASQIAAYERLSDPMQHFLQHLTAEHSAFDYSAVHPIVHRHRLTGQKALSVHPTFTRRIVELDLPESDAVLGMLYANAIRPESICRWRWTAGDVAIWDNHFVLHYVVTDYDDLPRTIHRIEIEGEALLPGAA
jgi:taurine dioxygenase